MDLPSLLVASLNPATRKTAEQNLNALSIQQGFLSHLLGLILDSTKERSVRLAGSVFLKNIAKSRWEEDVNPISEQDKTALRAGLVPAMLTLSADAGDRAIRAQTAESISLIAELDFPAKWPDLIDHLTSSLSPTSSSTNIAILQTSHSIFSQWRVHVRSDVLFTEINLVLSKFMEPFLGLFRHTAGLLLTPPPTLDTSSSNGEYAAQAQTMALLMEIFYDFTCQDLPPALEDAHAEFFSPPEGWFQKLLAWNAPGLNVDPDETTPSLPSQIKTGILQIAELYLQLYPEQLQQTGTIESFMQGVWTMIGNNNMPGISDDGLVSQSLRFLSATIRSNHYTSLFAGPTLSTIVQSIVVTNVLFRESDEEMFTDDPLEFIRLSLFDSTTTSAAGLATGADGRTRRQAAADVLKALVGSGFEREATAEVEKWVQMGLQQYNGASVQERVQGQGWKAKDGAVYLMMAVATRGSTSQQGVTSTNALVDVVQFFSDHVFADLDAQEGSVHPILQVDAIRYLLSFRNQLTKPQLLSVLPLLVRHLTSQNYVTYTYAAITIDRILSIRRDGANLFAQADIHELAPNLLATLLSKIESAGTPEKVAENDHLMKSAMRVILTARQTLTPGYEQTLRRLVGILGVISKNPSNPLFDQYIFESISGLMRFVVEGTPTTLPTFENELFGPFTIILQQDIEQYVPYVFQLLAQMLSLHKSDVPDQYRPLLPLLFTPATWQQKGSIPGLVRLLKAFLARDSAQMMAAGQIANVLAVVQQRLIPSKLNDVWGFELLQSVVASVRPADLRQYFKSVIMTLLTRMQSSKTDKFVYLLAKFLLHCCALNVEGFGPDYVIETIDDIQPRLWTQIMTNFVVPQVPLMPQKDRKLAIVGYTRLLTRSSSMMQEPNVQLWPPAFTSLVQLLRSQYLAGATTSTTTTDDNTSVGITDIDQEEQTAGYQAAYSRLAASETTETDPVAYVRDPEEFLRNELREMRGRNGQQLQTLLAATDANIVGPFNVM
ncbi:Importin N-terminal domain-containing protein [Mycena sanguinolenta]|uniref:Importin N-terminal domain-containing protein n=1 Tax=Mycena sanguinolenta TaxID=230812 RepID=A0A8H6Z1Z2_9AGAR|nr:Importin N-terminal domain-containing protein [Mycena sanguinolenta]